MCAPISVCVVEVKALLAAPPEETADHPPATVIYSLRTGTTAHPPNSERGLNYDCSFLWGKKGHFIWLSVVRCKLHTAGFASRLSIHLTWDENYDLVNSCMPASSTANTSIIHLKAFIFYLILFSAYYSQCCWVDVSQWQLEWQQWVSSWSNFRINL